MSPLEALQAQRQAAEWLDDATAIGRDHLGRYHYALAVVTPAAILDLARLTLEGWRTYITRSEHGLVLSLIEPETP